MRSILSLDLIQEIQEKVLDGRNESLFLTLIALLFTFIDKHEYNLHKLIVFLTSGIPLL